MVIGNNLNAKILGVRHSGYFVPEFGDGERGIGQRAGRIIVRHYGPNLTLTRHPREVAGWRLACRCDRIRQDQPAVRPWAGDQFWARVVDPNDHDPLEYRVYAPDELTVDVTEVEDVAGAARNVWERDHIRNWSALSRIATAIRDMRASRSEFHAAVTAARNTGLADPVVLNTMGLRPDEIEFLDELLAGESDG